MTMTPKVDISADPATFKAFPLDFKPVSPSDYVSLGVKLTGRVLNVMTLLPTQISRTNGRHGEGKWVVEPVRGHLALYLSQMFLDQQTEWETHLIGWTGELINKTSSPHEDPESITSSTSSTSSLYILTENIQEDPLYLTDDDKLKLEEGIRKANDSDNIHTVWLLRRDQERWRRYAENTLWPVFHYLQGQALDGKAETEAWYDYVRFNEAYLKKIKSIYQPGDVIWIHDYYLLLLPQLLRMSFPDACIGFFLHAPFPSSEYFRCLSKRTQILDGMLGADRIVFQSESFQRHFRSCCARLLGYDTDPDKIYSYGSTIELQALPIGIDTAKIEYDAFQSKEVSEKVKLLRDIYSDKKVIIGRDRLDLVRGVVQKLQAFELFLEMYPEWRGKVVLVQVSSPGYSSLSKKVATKVTELVNHINSEYGSFNSTPVLHYQLRIPKEEYLALLRVADLALITSVRDGMNTTSLEYVATQKGHNSPLILSEFSGTASVLRDAILINPWDPVGVAKTINECLHMTPEACQSLEERLYKEVVSNNVQKWTSKFLKGLVDQFTTKKKSLFTPALNRPLLLQNYKKASRRLFLFDYDGTLSPIVKDPAAAIPSTKLNKIIDLLAEDPQNRIWLISGRDQAFLEKWFGHKHVGLSAEHGCFMKDIGKDSWYNLAEKFDMSWQKEVATVFDKYNEKTPGAHTETKQVALTWHYRRADPELGEFQAKLCMQELLDGVGQHYDVEVMAGKANIEVRPKFVNKGEIVRRLVLSEYGSEQESSPIVKVPVYSKLWMEKLPDFILCLGDDKTDEDMFKVLKEIEKEWLLHEKPKNSYDSFGIYPTAVGPASKQTIATSHLNNPDSVIETLGLLTGQVSLFESAGSVDLDDRGHVQDSQSSIRSQEAIKSKSESKKNN